jgi:hypothetical protein
MDLRDIDCDMGGGWDRLRIMTNGGFRRCIFGLCPVELRASC